MSLSEDKLRTAIRDRYAIEREIGAGGMATVYLAHDLKHDRKVAVKVLREEIATAVGATRFLTEIKTTANLQHPHILALHDSGEAGGFLFYVMPFVNGESLRDRLTREKQLSLGDALRIAGEVADALDYAHRAGIVHRDIKPENILLTEGHAVVADFGIARVTAAPDAGRVTQMGEMIGTPAYLSPEQVTGEPLDGTSDLYSLGCVLYECLTGELPFAGNMMAMLAQRMTAAPPSARGKRNEVSVQLDQVIAKAMATAPADRFRTCRELAAALARPADASGLDGRGIVVLPFANRSPDPENEYFSDGLTEEIISDLAGIRSLRVISRTSAMRLKGTDKDIRTIGRELGVRYVLEGSVRKAGNSLRITAQLIDAERDVQLWGEKYSGTMDDVFELQERVSREIVAALGITLTTDEDRRLAHRSIENVRAFEFYLQARMEIRRYGSAINHGMVLLNRAIEIEGDTPAFQALGAWARVALIRSGIAADGSATLAEAETIARGLVERMPELAYGHSLLGFVSYERGHMAAAVRHFEAGLEREPNDADALFFLGVAWIAAGQNEQAEATARRLMASDPLSPLAWMLTGFAPWFSGRFTEGLPSLVRGVELDPESLIGRWTLGYGLALAGDLAGAARQAAYMHERAPTMPYTLHLLSLVDSLSGRKTEGLARLADAVGLDGHHKGHLAEAFAMGGDTTRGMVMLREAVNDGFHGYDYLAKHCPFFAPLHALPEYQALMERARRLTDGFMESVATVIGKE